MKINPNTKAHGKAAALALLERLEKLNGTYHDRPPEDIDRESLAHIAAYLHGYRDAPVRAQAGFEWLLGDYLTIVTGGCVPDLDYYSKPKYYGRQRPPSEREREAHARVWLKRDDPV